jgi:hypothetical protein
MKISAVILALAFLACGCIESHRKAVYYAPVPPPTPTSTSPDVRVYSNPESTPPPNVAPGDIALATSISQLLKGESHLAGISSQVTVRVRNGIVTLSGSVRTEQDRTEIINRVSQLPGVNEVRDELGVER